MVTSTRPFRAARLPPIPPAAETVALSGIVSVGFEPSEVIVTLPDALPLAVGANLTVKLVLCPALNVTGRLMPLRLKPEPEAVAPVIFRFEPPEFVRVCVTVWLLPTVTEPKAIEVGLAVTDPSAMPLPLSGIVSVGFEPSDVMVTLPVELPVADGANLTLKLTLWPAFKVVGKAKPVMLKPGPEADAAEIFRLDPPELVNVSVVD